MFKEPEVFTEADFRLIRSLGNTEGGAMLSQYLEAMAETEMRNMLNDNPNDAAKMAGGQSGARSAMLVRSLLRDDIQTILDQHNVEVKDE